MGAATKNYDELSYTQDELIRKARLSAMLFRLWQTEHAATLIPQRWRVLGLHRWPLSLADAGCQGDWLWGFGASAAGASGRSRTG